MMVMMVMMVMMKMKMKMMMMMMMMMLVMMMMMMMVMVMMMMKMMFIIMMKKQVVFWNDDDAFSHAGCAKSLFRYSGVLIFYSHHEHFSHGREMVVDPVVTTYNCGGSDCEVLSSVRSLLWIQTLQKPTTLLVLVIIIRPNFDQWFG